MRCGPLLENLWKVARAYGCRPSELLAATDPLEALSIDLAVLRAGAEYESRIGNT